MALDGLAGLFEAALAPLVSDGVLHTTVVADDGLGGFDTTAMDHPVKVVIDGMSERDRVASGLDADALTLTVFRAGLSAAIAVDDGITVGAASYRVVGVTRGAGDVSFSVVAVLA